MEKYLYGAAVQGIQSFIFQTNELQDIAGASNLVEEICTKMFDDYGKNGVQGESIVRAAGNIKFLFSKREDCEKAVMEFPKKVMEAAPGITISQAVVKYEEESKFGEYVEELERRLRIQRNMPMPSLTFGFMAMERNRKTGLPAIERDKDDYIDMPTKAKKKKRKDLSEKCFGEQVKAEKYAFDIKNITGNNDWIAVIHADGNGLGKIIETIGHNQKELQKFSPALDKATEIAAQTAFSIIHPRIEKDKKINKDQIIPIRPVVLGGDDFTVICRASFALEYAEAFIREFEAQALKQTGEKLTCCAGIAFIKSSFPFYYGYNLAEELCSAAKKASKKEAEIRGLDYIPSSLMFHKVQDSFVVDYKLIEKRELTPYKGHSWNCGPYYINKERKEADKDLTGLITTNVLTNYVEQLANDDKNVVKSKIRQWMSAMHESPNYAEQLARRAMDVLSDDSKDLFKCITSPAYTIEGENPKEITMYYPAYDTLSIYSVINQTTK